MVYSIVSNVQDWINKWSTRVWYPSVVSPVWYPRCGSNLPNLCLLNPEKAHLSDVFQIESGKLVYSTPFDFCDLTKRKRITDTEANYFGIPSIFACDF